MQHRLGGRVPGRRGDGHAVGAVAVGSEAAAAAGDGGGGDGRTDTVGGCSVGGGGGQSASVFVLGKVFTVEQCGPFVGQGCDRRRCRGVGRSAVGADCGGGAAVGAGGGGGDDVAVRPPAPGWRRRAAAARDDGRRRFVAAAAAAPGAAAPAGGRRCGRPLDDAAAVGVDRNVHASRPRYWTTSFVKAKKKFNGYR